MLAHPRPSSHHPNSDLREKKTTKMTTFYLAASYPTREEMLDLALGIAADSSHRCIARWLTGAYEDGPLSRAAHDDMEDIYNAQAFVMNLAPSVSRGKYTELGYALALLKPILLFGTQGKKMEDSVFFNVHELVTWAPAHAGSEEIIEWLDKEAKR